MEVECHQLDYPEPPAITGLTGQNFVCTRGAYDIKYRKNEIFVDFIETIDMMVSNITLLGPLCCNFARYLLMEM